MPLNVSKKLKNTTGEAGKLLHGSDVPEDVQTFEIEVSEFRDAPEDFNSPVIADLAHTVFDADSFAVNKTNLRALVSHLGETLPDRCLVKLAVIKTRNPKTREDVRSLRVVSAQELTTATAKATHEKKRKRA